MPDTVDEVGPEQGPHAESVVEQGVSKKPVKKFFIGRAGEWTALFTFVLMVFSGLLWRVSDKANETSISTQRAFISFSGPGFAKNIDGHKLRGIKVFYVMSNSGTTPARAGVSQWNMFFGQTVPQKGLDFDGLPQLERLSVVLGPKAGFQLTPVSISVEDLEEVAEGKRHLFFWGWTTYHDIFNGTPERLSEFCTEIVNVTWTKPDHADATGDINTVSPPCPTHNCYDEDCEDYSRRVQ